MSNKPWEDAREMLDEISDNDGEEEAIVLKMSLVVSKMPLNKAGKALASMQSC